jgi:hypothetical protein
VFIKNTKLYVLLGFALAGDEEDLEHVCELVTKLEFVDLRTGSPRHLGEQVGRNKCQSVGDHLKE